MGLLNKIRKLALGGEGAPGEEGAIQVNTEYLLDREFRTARDGTIGLEAVKAAGPVVIARSNKLPFANGCVDCVIANNVPLDRNTGVGPGYTREEIRRIVKQDGEIYENGEKKA